MLSEKPLEYFHEKLGMVKGERSLKFILMYVQWLIFKYNV